MGDEACAACCFAGPGIQFLADTLPCRHARFGGPVDRASCGGGGSGSGGQTPVQFASAPAPPPSITPSCEQTHDRGCVTESEFEAAADELAIRYGEGTSFENQWGLEAIGADRAYAHLELLLGADAKPGEGQTVGILDTGIDRLHPAFRNKLIVERFLASARNEPGTRFSHGTVVSGVIAGEESPRLSDDASGVAWSADLAIFAIPLGSGDGTYRPIRTDRLQSNGEFFADVIGEMLDQRHGTPRIDFLNLSLGVTGIIDNYSEAALRRPHLRDRHARQPAPALVRFHGLCPALRAEAHRAPRNPPRQSHMRLDPPQTPQDRRPGPAQRKAYPHRHGIRLSPRRHLRPGSPAIMQLT